MYLCTRNYDLKRGGTFETAKAGTFHSVTAGTLIPLSPHNSNQNKNCVFPLGKGVQELIGKCSGTNLLNNRVFNLENTLSLSPTIVTICQRTPKTTRDNPPDDSQIQFFTSSLNRSALVCLLSHHVHSCYNFRCDV